MGKRDVWACPKCSRNKQPTRHHWLPRRFFGETNNIILLCRDCHDDIEKIIPQKEQLTRDKYWAITQKFLQRR